MPPLRRLAEVSAPDTASGVSPESAELTRAKLLSREAQAALLRLFSSPMAIRFPARTTSAWVWRHVIANYESAAAPWYEALLGGATASVRAIRMAEVAVHHASPANSAWRGIPRAILFIHGGAFILGGGKGAAAAAAAIASGTGFHVYAVDYRMAPDHPYPAAIVDVVKAYRHLLKTYRPEDIAVLGESAGGNIAASAMLAARDQGLPMPCSVLLSAPTVDLTQAGDTYSTALRMESALKPVFDGLSQVFALYAGAHPLNDAGVSPLFGDFAKGFPPTVILAGAQDLLLSSSMLLHRALRRCGIDVTLRIQEGMMHGPFIRGERDVSAYRRRIAWLNSFLDWHWG